MMEWPGIDSGSKCTAEHPLRLVAEGYAICSRGSVYYAWKLQALQDNIGKGWTSGHIWGRNFERIPALVSFYPYMNKDEVLEFIQQDMDRFRSAPFDEERERARLVAV